MDSIVQSILSGSNPHIKLRPDGLIETGSAKTQLTWMDASVSGIPVTPRHGCAVEINALWYNALMFYSELCRQKGIPYDQADETATRFRSSFSPLFWNDETNCLYDVVRDNKKDPSIRPNQIFAVSLPFSALPPEQEKAIVQKAADDLVTPYGLRTLSPADPRYKPTYEGNQENRDQAYHQGTVWPWLTGHFTQAYLKVNGFSNQARTFLKEKFEPLLEHFPQDFGIAYLPEIFNGSPPYKPKGCISQAWSHAEVIRAKYLLQGEETA
jgi:predicted glycogen debranching enzyme